MGEGKPQGTQSVKLVPSSFEWGCPICSTINQEDYTSEIVTCSKCGTSFFTEVSMAE